MNENEALLNRHLLDELDAVRTEAVVKWLFILFMTLFFVLFLDDC
jgi:hypothetical protein